MQDGNPLRYFSAVGRCHIQNAPQSMNEYLRYCKRNGMILKSGGAVGADKLFTDAYIAMGGSCMIMIPWNGSNGYFIEDSTNDVHISCIVSKQDYEIWNSITTTIEGNCIKILNARNVSIHANCDFCLYMDNKFEQNSGTQCGLQVCRKFGIPAFNILYDPFEQFLKQVEDTI